MNGTTATTTTRRPPTATGRHTSRPRDCPWQTYPACSAGPISPSPRGIRCPFRSSPLSPDSTVAFSRLPAHGGGAGAEAHRRKRTTASLASNRRGTRSPSTPTGRPPRSPAGTISLTCSPRTSAGSLSPGSDAPSRSPNPKPEIRKLQSTSTGSPSTTGASTLGSTADSTACSSTDRKPVASARGERSMSPGC